MAVAEREVTPRVTEVTYRPESIDSYNVCTNNEKAEIQVAFLRAFHLDQSTGRYELVQTERAHQFDTELPEISHQLLSGGRAVVFLAQHNDTEFNWGEETIMGKPFLALHWFTRVDTKGNAEEFIFRLNGFSEEQAKKFLELFLENKNIEPKLEEEKLVSFREEFDPVGYPKPYLTELAETIFNSESPKSTLSLTEKTYREEFIKQISGLSLMRYLTHNPAINNYTLKPKFVLDENGNGCLITFDRIMGRWGRMDSSTTNGQVLHNLRVAQDKLRDYYLDPSPFKGDININMPTMLSPRTAGLRPGEDLAADQNLRARPNGDIDLSTNIVPGRMISPELFREPGVTYLSPSSDLSLRPISPLIPALPPILPLFPMGGGGFMVPISPEVHSDNMINAVPVANSVGLGLAMLAPLLFHLDSAVSLAALQIAPLTSDTIRPVVSEELPEQNIVQTEQITESLDGLTTPSIAEIPFEENTGDTDIIFSEQPEPDFPDSPINPELEPTGGGGLRLPQEMKTTIWNESMKERLEAARKPKTVFVDKVVPDKYEDQVIFDASKESQEVKFKEYANDLEVLSVEAVANTKVFEQENAVQLLLANSHDKIAQDPNCDKTLLEQDFVTVNQDNDKIAESNHYDTAQYHSETNLPKDEVVSKKTESAAKLEEPKPQKLDKNTHRTDRKKRIAAVAFNNLLLSYVRQRQILSELLKQNISTPESPDSDGLNIKDKPKEQKSVKPDNNSFLKRAESNKTQTQNGLLKQILRSKTKVKTKATSPAFLSLLLLTKIKLLSKARLLVKKNNFAALKQLFVTDTLLLFLLNPKLFLVNRSAVAD